MAVIILNGVDRRKKVGLRDVLTTCKRRLVEAKRGEVV